MKAQKSNLEKMAAGLTNLANRTVKSIKLAAEELSKQCGQQDENKNYYSLNGKIIVTSRYGSIYVISNDLNTDDTDPTDFIPKALICGIQITSSRRDMEVIDKAYSKCEPCYIASKYMFDTGFINTNKYIPIDDIMYTLTCIDSVVNSDSLYETMHGIYHDCVNSKIGSVTLGTRDRFVKQYDGITFIFKIFNTRNILEQNRVRPIFNDDENSLDHYIVFDKDAINSFLDTLIKSTSFFESCMFKHKLHFVNECNKPFSDYIYALAVLVDREKEASEYIKENYSTIYGSAEQEKDEESDHNTDKEDTYEDEEEDNSYDKDEEDSYNDEEDEDDSPRERIEELLGHEEETMQEVAKRMYIISHDEKLAKIFYSDRVNLGAKEACKKYHLSLSTLYRNFKKINDLYPEAVLAFMQDE